MSPQELAQRIHAGQLYGQQPYKYHLQHVAAYVRLLESKDLAWLHDSLEDHPDCIDLIKQNTSDELLHHIQIITHSKDETYFEYINRLVASDVPEVIDVKIADLKSNLSENPEPSLRQRYTKALSILESVDF